MADQIVVVSPDSTGKKIDVSELTVGANTVERQRINISDPTVAANHALVNAAGALKVAEGKAATPTESSISATTTDALYLASNASRLGATVYNNSGQILYLLLNTTTTSSTNFTVKMVDQSYYEVPFGYTGAIRGVLAAGSGNVQVNEFAA